MILDKKIEEKIAKGIKYLKLIGCKEIILFGSLIDGTFDEHSDIDLAVSGIIPRNYFKAVVTLPSVIGHKVDLVALDYVSKDFEKKIRKEGRTLFAE
ncbi:MAG: nucleotidyltransferase family protein [Candidatus Helarchaeota archaeon]